MQSGDLFPFTSPLFPLIFSPPHASPRLVWVKFGCSLRSVTHWQGPKEQNLTLGAIFGAGSVYSVSPTQDVTQRGPDLVETVMSNT